MSSATISGSLEGADFEPLFADYLNRLQRRRRIPQTVVNFINSAKPFQTWLRSQGLKATEVSEEHLYDYFGQSAYAPGTQRLHGVQLRAAYSYGHKQGVIQVDPFADFLIPSAPTPNPTEKVIPNSELREMHDRCEDDKQELLWALLTYGGFRRDEVRCLNWEDLDWDTRSFSIVGKGDKRRVVPVHPFLQELLASARQQRMQFVIIDGLAYEPTADRPADPPTGAIIAPHLSTKPYSNGAGFSKLLKKFTDRSFHDFRKTLATSLYRNDVDGLIIDKILGWSPIGVRARYYDGTQYDQLQAAIRKAYLNDPVA